MAVIVADPTAKALTNPVVETCATPTLLVDQITERPVRTFPAASLTTAISCALSPIGTSARAGTTDTVPGGIPIGRNAGISSYKAPTVSPKVPLPSGLLADMPNDEFGNAMRVPSADHAMWPGTTQPNGDRPAPSVPTVKIESRATNAILRPSGDHVGDST